MGRSLAIRSDDVDTRYRLALLDQLRVPLFGSPPSGWATLRDYIDGLASGPIGTTAVLTAAATTGMDAPWLILLGLGPTVIVRYFDPLARVIGDSHVARIQKRLRKQEALDRGAENERTSGVSRAAPAGAAGVDAMAGSPPTDRP